MSNTQPRYFVMKPVSEKPDTNRWYFCLHESGHEKNNITAYFEDGGWFFSDGFMRTMPEPGRFTHYLSPVTEDELVKEVERLRADNIRLKDVIKQAVVGLHELKQQVDQLPDIN